VAAEAAGIPVREVTDFSALADRGVTGRIGDHVFCLENPRLMTENGFTEPNPSSRIITLERQGNSVVLLTDDTPYDEQTNKYDASYLSFILT
jgi:Cd2+/Zn2+-exporting ATPase